MDINKGDKFLITTDNWFIAPDGVEYRAVWGTVNGIIESENTLGIKTNAKSTNWYVSIGNMIIAGCQIHYAIKTDKVNFGEAQQHDYNVEHGCKKFKRPTHIYNANN